MYKQPDKDEVAKRLRELADHIESNKWPQVFSWEEDESEIISAYKLRLSHPWPS